MRLTLFIIFQCSFFLSFAQIPAGYYNDAFDKSGDDLKDALHTIINGHTQVSYDALWNYFDATDKKTNGKVWDIYSTNPGGSNYEYTIFSDQCGNYAAEGDCYNREHIVPQSWFNGASPMYSDLFHMYPTDGYVNGKRADYPFGEVGNANYTSSNGSRLGNNTTSGYSGTVFEPIDQYKGDLARVYFYMAIRYRNIVQNWNGEAFQGNDLSNWTKDLLLDWHEMDPVSQKEIDRNEEIYNVQNNRNPFVDHPEWATHAWVWATSINEQNTNKEKIWINNGILYSSSNMSNIEIYSVTGAYISSISFSKQVDVSNLENGVYLIRNIDSNQNFKFIKR